MPEIARTSVWLSESTSIKVISKLVAMQRAALIATASATRGDLTEASTAEPVIGVLRVDPEKIHPNPASSFSLLHAASVLQVVLVLSELDGGRGACQTCFSDVLFPQVNSVVLQRLRRFLRSKFPIDSTGGC